jgi:hypothetical protein
MSTILPVFRGKPLIEIPTEIPQAGFMEGDFGKAFFEEYKGRVKSDYDNVKSLNVLSYNNGIVRGSNPFAVVLANQILKQEGLRTASQADLEKILKINAMNLTGSYEDTALVLRNEDNPNSYLAKNLRKQIKSRNPKQKMPVMIPLNRLKLRKDQSSDYGLAFNLTDETELVYSPILCKESGNFDQKDINEKTGLPAKLGNGNRYLYTINSGLSRLFLYRSLSVDSDDGVGLGVSFDIGRVVLLN